MTPVLVDASFLISIYNKSDLHHRRCMHVHDSLERPMVTCEAVIAESLYRLRPVYGAANALLSSIENDILRIPFAIRESAPAVNALMAKYADTPADFADACLIAMADLLGTGDILTLDSDFRHYRWRRNRRFNLLVSLD